MATIPRSALRRRRLSEVLREEVVQQIWIERIQQAQEEEGWIVNVTKFLVGIWPRWEMKMRRRVLWLLQIMKWTRQIAIFLSPIFGVIWKSYREDPSRATWIFAERPFVPLPHEFGRGPPKNRKDLPSDTIQFPLERVMSEHPTVCGRMCGLYF